jgi:hypothetical protein
MRLGCNDSTPEEGDELVSLHGKIRDGGGGGQRMSIKE